MNIYATYVLDKLLPVYIVRSETRIYNDNSLFGSATSNNSRSSLSKNYNSLAMQIYNLY